MVGLLCGFAGYGIGLQRVGLGLEALVTQGAAGLLPLTGKVGGAFLRVDSSAFSA